MSYQVASGSRPQPVEMSAQQAYDQFWPRQQEDMRCLEAGAFKQQELPLARIKKIMKLDDDVKMISAEAPMLFAKAAEIFIHELTMRAWIHTEDNKRRTLQRNDIAMAIAKYDQFDFLIDIVPREDIKPAAPSAVPSTPRKHHESTDQQVTYYMPGQGPPGNPLATGGEAGHHQASQPTAATAPGTPQQPQVIQLQPQQMVNTMAPPPGGIQIVQQVVGADGQIQQIPIQLTSQQLQMIRSQMVGSGQQQPLVIHCPVQTQPTTGQPAAAAAPQAPADPNQQQIMQ